MYPCNDNLDDLLTDLDDIDATAAILTNPNRLRKKRPTRAKSPAGETSFGQWVEDRKREKGNRSKSRKGGR